VLDLERRMAVVRADDDGKDAFPHALRGTLAAMLTEPTWHVVVALGHAEAPRDAVSEVLRQAAGWASEGGCRLSVASLRDLGQYTMEAVRPDLPGEHLEA
jgi:hypothetical protein